MMLSTVWICYEGLGETGGNWSLDQWKGDWSRWEQKTIGLYKRHRDQVESGNRIDSVRLGGGSTLQFDGAAKFSERVLTLLF